MDLNNDLSQKRELIKEKFYSLFRKNGFNSYDSFGFNVWFLRKNMKNNISSQEYFEELLYSTPKEDDDIIKFIIMKSIKNSEDNKNRIFVANFINEIVEQILNLDTENERIENLINKYDAYKTVNIIDQNILHIDKYQERVFDLSKSYFTCYISKIKNIQKGEYSFTLITSKNNTYENDNFDNEIFEYKLNHIISVEEETNEEIDFIMNEYEFPKIEFFCKDEVENSENGTNLLNFQLKIENLSKKYEDYILSDKYKFLELLISNSQNLLNNFEKIKTLNAQILLQNSFYDICVNLVYKIEFDPITLIAIYNKIKNLLQNIIAYKVRIEHKYKTILTYFEEISDDIKIILHPVKKESNCILF
jgi:hypothetical protein